MLVFRRSPRGSAVVTPGEVEEVDASPAPRQAAEPPSPVAKPGAAADRSGTGSRRDLTFLWWINAADGLGSQASGLVFPLLLLNLGHTPATAGTFASVAAFTGVLLGPLVAVPADRGHRRRIMTGAALLAAVAMAGLSVCCAGHPALGVLVGLALAERLCAVAYEAASRGALVHLAAPDELPRAAAGLQAGDQTALILGPALGGMLFQLARPLPFLADAVSYAATALGVRAIRGPLDPPPPRGDAVERQPGVRPTARALPGAVKAGLAVVAHSPVLRLALLWTSAAGGVLALLFYTAVFVLGGGAHSASTGAVLTAPGAAGLLGSLAAPRAVRRLGPRRALTSATWLLIVPSGALLWAERPWSWGLGFAGLSLLLPLVTVVLTSAAVAATPVALQSRAGAVLGSAATLTAAGAPAAAAALVTAWGTRAPALLCTVLLGLLAVYTQFTARGALSGTAGAGGDTAASAASGAGRQP